LSNTLFIGEKHVAPGRDGVCQPWWFSAGADGSIYNAEKQ
jgi:hypothetical protein